VHEAIRFWESQVYVRPDESESVLPSASDVTAVAVPPFWLTPVSRLAAS
jgi:hypothetical protein